MEEEFNRTGNGMVNAQNTLRILASLLAHTKGPWVGGASKISSTATRNEGEIYGPNGFIASTYNAQDAEAIAMVRNILCEEEKK